MPLTRQVFSAKSHQFHQVFPALAPNPRPLYNVTSIPVNKGDSMEHAQDGNWIRKKAEITVRFEPSGKEETMPRVKTVLQLLNKLGVKRGTALVIRDGGLLTPDREILPDDVITVRTVVSQG